MNHPDQGPAPAPETPGARRDISSAGVPECLANDERRTVAHGVNGKTDDKTKISKNLCLEACNRACAVKVYFEHREPNGRVQPREGVGQIGFLRSSGQADLLPVSPGATECHYAVTPVTAKHNLCKVETLDHPFYPADAKHFNVLLKDDTMETLNFDDLNVSLVNQPPLTLQTLTTGDANWVFGHDVSFGQKITTRVDGITNEGFSFEVASDAYKFTKDQRVGIAVYNTTVTSAKNASAKPNQNPLRLSQELLKEIYGPAKVSKVYTGKITHVGAHHIEYDINSFQGCSGAILFPLDMEQENYDVDESDQGKAIAVHVGTHPTLLDRNFGFKLTREKRAELRG